jgi:hypothetical protein
VVVRVLMIWCVVSIASAPLLGAFLSGLAEPAEQRLTRRSARSRSAA